MQAADKLNSSRCFMYMYYMCMFMPNDDVWEDKNKSVKNRNEQIRKNGAFLSKGRKFISSAERQRQKNKLLRSQSLKN